MTDLAKYVDVFLGCDTINLPKPEGVAASWKFIKGLCGNNHPGAALPFGRMTCGCYDGAYSAGYGRNKPNCGGPIAELYDENKFIGFSHIHHSGTGYIRLFYNYAVTSPFIGKLENAFIPRTIISEDACPGWYSVKTDGVLAEATVTRACALHHWHFDREGGRLAIDFSNDGLDRGTGAFSRPSAGIVRRLSDCEASAEVVLQGVKLYFHAICTGAARCTLFSAVEELTVDVFDAAETLNERFGCIFNLAEKDAELTLCVTTAGADRAAELARTDSGHFKQARDIAYGEWNDALSKIKLGDEDEAVKSKFYSYLYHTLLKPSDWTGEGLYGGGEFYGDLCTMWDIYKTQLPLVFTLFPEVTRGVMQTFVTLTQRTGKLPHALLLAANREIEVKQARTLAQFSIADAYYRRTGSLPDTVRGILTAALLEAAESDIFRDDYRDFTGYGKVESATQHLDMCEACRVIAAVAAETGKTELAKRLLALYERFPEAYGADGLMREDSWYYEGTRWNYSFRLVSEPERRIALAGGSECYNTLADRFFGFATPDDTSERFEGFNNETDMEAPYAYHFTGRHDRLAEVISGGDKYMFSVGRGGVPGNNDSGGLTSCWLWNALGIFPVSGQDKMIIGSPVIKRAELSLASGQTFIITAHGKGIYVKSATLNGRSLPKFEFTVSEMMDGGNLELELSENV
jgi:Putative alpha-1,2-mannosidase